MFNICGINKDNVFLGAGACLSFSSTKRDLKPSTARFSAIRCNLKSLMPFSDCYLDRLQPYCPL